MVSISSAGKIKERTREFCDKIQNWDEILDSYGIFKKIDIHLQNEYDLIPDKERIGKGNVYISRHVAKILYSYLKSKLKMPKNDLIQLSKKCLEYKKRTDTLSVFYVALFFLAEYIENHPRDFETIVPLLKKLANKEDWKLREGVIYPIISGLKKAPEIILPFLSKWSTEDNEYLRRLVAESLRPIAEVKWLRNPEKNDEVLKILTQMRKDRSLYVRKAVGNNIKDLSKYMPEKMLQLMEDWLNKSSIKVHDKLATEIGLNRDEKRLISTIKQAMRWIKDRNPEFHKKLESILGSYYVLYFNEKSNRLAKPPSF